MKVVMIAVESAPYIKVGGLGDVVHSLSKTLVKMGHGVSVIMPLHKRVRADLKKVADGLRVYLDHEWKSFSLYEDTYEGVKYFFVDYPPYYRRDHVYAPPKGDYEDNALRFGFFSLAGLEVIRQTGIAPDVIHAHDWHTAMVGLYKQLYYQDLNRVAFVFTIHNGMHQGIFDSRFLPNLSLPWEVFHPFGGIEFYGKINFLKAGINFCDVLTTVSPSYAEELKQYAYGLEGVIREKKYFFGVLNGIDYEVWDPEKDRYIKAYYSIRNFKKGKQQNKKHLKEVFGLGNREDMPLVGMVSRLTSQKGFDIIKGVIDEAVALGFEFVFLGSGEEVYQNMLIEFMKKYPKSVRVRIEYNEELAHKIYAGSDIFLMPSLFEPCGISQMIAMRYGTVPVVRKVGGLKDTVIDIAENPEEGTGFVFEEYKPEELLHAMLKAAVYYQMEKCDASKRWSELIKRCMSMDFSWQKSAREYEGIYSSAILLRRYDN
ncbi:MAG: glycogen synthase GlgA [Hydrogenobacter thermophilus]|uniref:glycogen synthase GlgA n=1 Tax=Hydrogenobacter thermophilus TaxID=940 RepID=UPI001C768A9F|nr:glycogen synthase GlgA [Hydrogenobacter thermophilus]QWK19985.1 MAG: glycogen synthase GlgA [Hydrogenobacter thermophilus]